MDLEVDVNSHEASPFVDIYQAEVMFLLNFNTVKSVDGEENPLMTLNAWC